MRFFGSWRVQVGREEGRQDREQDQRDRDGDEEQQPPGEPRVERDARVGRGRTVAGHRGRAAGVGGRMVGRRAGAHRGRARDAERVSRRRAAGCGAAAVGLRGPVNARRALTFVPAGALSRSYTSQSTPVIAFGEKKKLSPNRCYLLTRRVEFLFPPPTGSPPDPYTV